MNLSEDDVTDMGQTVDDVDDDELLVQFIVNI